MSKIEGLNLVQRTVKNLKEMTFLESLTTVIASVEPIVSIPQVQRLWVTRSAEDIVLFPEVFGLISAVIWLIYGITIKNIPIIVSGSLWFLIATPMVIAVLLYG
ncbi:MAG: SemiSWEET family transporter [Candidatus Saccharimonadales bacterium]|nr:SemiSWEET family transporter [Candidatus Saccharimonadales bacterium]